MSAYLRMAFQHLLATACVVLYRKTSWRSILDKTISCAHHGYLLWLKTEWIISLLILCICFKKSFSSTSSVTVFFIDFSVLWLKLIQRLEGFKLV